MSERMKDVTPPVELSSSPEAGTRAAALSSTLRKMAIKARSRKHVWVPSYIPARRWEHTFNAYVLRAFIAIVVVPVAVAALYLAFFVSDQYMSETRFAVRGAERASFDPLGGLLGGAGNRAQEAAIIVEYLNGRGIVEELERKINLRRRFAAPGIDILSRFNPNDAIEDLIQYWRWHINADIDRLSGIVTIEVFAFTPQDALEISQAILAASEQLVNELSERSRRDALQQTQSELKRAEAGLQASIRAMQDLRNAEGLLDADKTSEAMIQMVADMRLELIRMEREYAAQRKTVDSGSPQLRVLESRIKAAHDQIGKLETQMTGVERRKEKPALAESMSRFEQLKLEHEIAQKRYVAASASFEKARVDLSTQQIYLTTFVPPTLAQSALYPRRMWIFIIVLAGCLALWGSGVGIAVLVRNHMG